MSGGDIKSGRIAVTLATVASVILSFEGAAKTSAYYSIAPFLGVAFGMLILGERPALQFYVALAVMIVSTYFMIQDTIELQHTHEHNHTQTHEHAHGV